MNEIMENEMISIDDMIYEVRGVQVMLDSDLAELYQVETKRINEAVKNNPDKFPERFSFVLDDFEKKNLWSKFSTANISNMSRVNPRVFTEQGVYMLATILKSKVATKVSIAIMDAFVKMRHYINYNYRVLPHRFLLLEENIDVAKRGGKIDGNARKKLEDELGESVITSSNLLNYEYKDEKQLIDN